MGGCRCVYRTCQSSTTVSPSLHYFHFPVRDPERCEQWISNSRKPMLRAIPKEKLRNKVICSLHFEKRCFTNEKHDRLIHNAVPTLGFEDAPEDFTTFGTPSDGEQRDDANIMLVPVNEDNTKFMLPDVGFSGMSYTIYDDAVIPTSTVPQYANSLEPKVNKISIVVKKQDIEPKPKRQKFTITSINKVNHPMPKPVEPRRPDPRREKPKENNLENSNGNSIMSYSVSTDGDDVTVELTREPAVETNEKMCTFSIDNNSINTPLLDNDISLKFKSGNQYTIVEKDFGENIEDVTEEIVEPEVVENVEEEKLIPKVSQNLAQNTQVLAQNSNQNPKSMTQNSNQILAQNLTQNLDQNLSQNVIEMPKLTHKSQLQNVAQILAQNVTQNSVAQKVSPAPNSPTQTTPKRSQCVPQKLDFKSTPEKEYIRMIKNNSRQIVQLKKLINKQNRLHKMMLQQRQLKFKRRKLNKMRLLDNLKQYLKPSLMAVLKLEILSNDEVVLTDSEEKFIVDLYTQNPECYNLLLKKYKWNLPNCQQD